MINIEKNTPSIYTRESRDFQFYCKLLEVVVNSSKYNIDNITNVYNPLLCNDRVLDLLKSCLNFNSNIDYTDSDLRIILNGFANMIKYKGTRRGIAAAISIVLKLYNYKADYYINIINKNDLNPYTIKIGTSKTINKNYLYDLLEYVKPVGYDIEIYMTTTSAFTSQILYSVEIEEDSASASAVSSIGSLSDSNSKANINRSQVMKLGDE